MNSKSVGSDIDQSRHDNGSSVLSLLLVMLERVEGPWAWVGSTDYPGIQNEVIRVSNIYPET